MYCLCYLSPVTCFNADIGVLAKICLCKGLQLAFYKQLYAFTILLNVFNLYFVD